MTTPLETLLEARKNLVIKDTNETASYAEWRIKKQQEIKTEIETFLNDQLNVAVGNNPHHNGWIIGVVFKKRYQSVFQNVEEFKTFLEENLVAPIGFTFKDPPPRIHYSTKHPLIKYTSIVLVFKLV